jgi:hypothetical protein
VSRHLLPLVLVGVAACARHPRPATDFVADQPTPSRVVTSGADSLFVLSTVSYDLISRRRDALWQQRALDDVAWQYRRLFNAVPPRVAFVLLDDRAVRRAELSEWSRVPMGFVRSSARHEDGPMTVAVSNGIERTVAWSSLPTVAVQTWLLGAADGADSSSRWPAYPSWFFVASTIIIGAPDIDDGLRDHVRMRLAETISLDSLFAVRGRERLLVTRDRSTFDPLIENPTAAAPVVGRPERSRSVSVPVFELQATAVLQYLRQRDPVFVSRLPEALARGHTMADLLPTAARLPRDVASLEAEWRQWVKTGKSRRVRA